jgi:hypothetical protein
VQVNPDLAQPPFDEPRRALIPPDWTLSVWARIPNARLSAWAPDGSLLVSAPRNGQVVRVEPSGAGPRLSVPLDGLDQPHCRPTPTAASSTAHRCRPSNKAWAHTPLHSA